MENKGTRKILGVVDMFTVSRVGMVSWEHTYANSLQWYALKIHSLL